jgi:hypothetical protein
MRRQGGDDELRRTRERHGGGGVRLPARELRRRAPGGAVAWSGAVERGGPERRGEGTVPL